MSESPTPSQEGTNYRLDGEPRALYHWLYRKRYGEVQEHLTPYEAITRELADEHCIELAMVGLPNINWNTFDLRKQDKQPINGLQYPGKSAHIDFTNSLYLSPEEIDMDTICDAVFGRKYKREDHLYVAQVQDLIAKGYTPFWAPIPNHPLHVRIVHNSQIFDAQNHGNSRFQKEELVKIWRKIK